MEWSFTSFSSLHFDWKLFAMRKTVKYQKSRFARSKADQKEKHFGAEFVFLEYVHEARAPFPNEVHQQPENRELKSFQLTIQFSDLRWKEFQRQS